ncbi:MAG: PSK operon transcription factor [Rhodobacterales bacterium CG15_BIG_FIL_POST_REV_8_21_14_020_59_13]|nr:MAG: PSK operon transcription factor [Rhodobacterales bacterium CG15_BIG_FIL_POST_REV_8_21_14_020_59_13]
MTLSIKDPETDRLARKLAELSGLSITVAVREALEAEIARLEREAGKDARAEKLREIVSRFPREYFKGITSADHDFLYGDDGLPE